MDIASTGRVGVSASQKHYSNKCIPEKLIDLRQKPYWKALSVKIEQMVTLTNIQGKWG